MVFVVSSSHDKTTRAPRIKPFHSEGYGPPTTTLLPTSPKDIMETNAKVAFLPSQPSYDTTASNGFNQPIQEFLTDDTTASNGVDQTIQEFLTEIIVIDVTMLVTSSTESVTELDMTIWVWSFSWSLLTILQLTISLIGILGNLLVVVVMAVRRSTSNSTDILIAALAVSDLLTSISNIPVPRALQVPDNIFGALYCRIIFTSILSWVCIISSSYILVGASFERLAAVAYPLRYKNVFSIRRAYVIITVSWLFACVSCCPYLLALIWDFKAVHLIYCIPTDPGYSLLKRVIILINFTIRLVIPVVLMMVSQTAMAIILHQKSRRAMTRNSRKPYHIVARNRVIKMMLVVVIIFILCWAPNQIAHVVVPFRGTSNAFFATNGRQILTVFTFINSSINPFIYAAHYPNFRSAIRDVFSGRNEQDGTLFGSRNSQASHAHTHTTHI
nr:gastrin/cholecystokinin type B receptor-like [Lytechinus pictus]